MSFSVDLLHLTLTTCDCIMKLLAVSAGVAHRTLIGDVEVKDFCSAIKLASPKG